MFENEEFEYEGKFGKIRSKGKGALILSCSVAVIVVGAGIYAATKDNDVLKKGVELAANGAKLLNHKP